MIVTLPEFAQLFFRNSVSRLGQQLLLQQVSLFDNKLVQVLPGEVEGFDGFFGMSVVGNISFIDIGVEGNQFV